MSVYVLDLITPRAMAALRRRAEVVAHTDPGIGRWPERAEAIIVRSSPAPGPAIRAARRLKVIGKHGVGLDKIDLAAARERGVRVVNVPGGSARTVAELALGLAVAAARRFVLADRRLRAGEVDDRNTFHGIELHGKRLGVVGLGNLGRTVVEVFRGAFSMRPFAFAPRTRPEDCRALGVARVETLAELMALADLLVVCVPLTPETRGLIGEDEIARMHRKAILINVSRGAVVDEAALARALGEGRLFGAGADVFSVEPPPPDHPLVRLPNFVSAPHMGAQTEEALDRVGLAVVEDVLSVLGGREPRFAVV